MEVLCLLGDRDLLLERDLDLEGESAPDTDDSDKNRCLFRCFPIFILKFSLERFKIIYLFLKILSYCYFRSKNYEYFIQVPHFYRNIFHDIHMDFK